MCYPNDIDLNNLTIHFGNKEQIEPKTDRRKEILKNWREINGTETTNEKRKINETKSQFLKNLYKNDRPLSMLN